jgi:hypothetical protein
MIIGVNNGIVNARAAHQNLYQADLSTMPKDYDTHLA